MGNFLLPLMIGANDRRLPAAQSLLVVSLTVAAVVHARTLISRRSRHRLDVLHPIFDHVFHDQRGAATAGVLVVRLLVDRDRHQFHRDDRTCCVRRG